MRRILMAVALLALPAFVFAQEPVVSGESILLQARTTGIPGRLFRGTDATGKPMWVYAAQASDGSVEILREGDRNPLLYDGEIVVGFERERLPGRRRLVSQQGQVDLSVVNGVMFFIAYDPSITVGGTIRLAYVMKKIIGGDEATTILGPTTIFPGYDPRVLNAPGDFTWQQTAILDVSSSGRVTVYGGAAPPLSPGTAPGSSSHAVINQLTEGDRWQMLYNNQLETASKAKLQNIRGMCVTNSGTLYILGQAGELPQGTPTGFLTIFRIVNREPQQAASYKAMFGLGMRCAENGVQTYRLETEGQTIKSFFYGFIPDSAPAGGSATGSAEQPFFQGLEADFVSLNTNDSPTPSGNTESLVILRNGSLMRIGSQPKLIKSSSVPPTGNIQQVLKVGEQILILLGGRVYYLYTPPTFIAPFSPRAGDTLTIPCKCAVGGRLPTLQLRLAGSDVNFGVTSAGDITFTVPSSTAPGRYEGAINIIGLIRPFVLNVRPTTEPATPVITLVTTPSGQAGPFGARSTATISFTGDPGRREFPDPDAVTWEMSGLSVFTAQGQQLRLLGNSGTGRLDVLVPANAGTSSQLELILNAKGNGITVKSNAYQVLTTEIAHNLHSVEFGIGYQFVQMFDDRTDQLGLAGTPFKPLVPESKFRVLGTGCGSGQIGDDQNTPVPGLEVGETTIQFGDQFIPVKVTIAPGTPGLCYYDGVTPKLASGRYSFGVVGSQQIFSVWVK